MSIQKVQETIRISKHQKCNEGHISEYSIISQTQTQTSSTKQSTKQKQLLFKIPTRYARASSWELHNFQRWKILTPKITQARNFL